MNSFQSRVLMRGIDELSANPGNARKHNRKQLRAIASSLKRFGFTNPVLISNEHRIICGHGRVEAAKMIGVTKVPTICLSHLSADELRAYALADNKIALDASWDNELLSIELQYLDNIEFDLDLTGFSTPEIDLVLKEATAAQADTGSDDIIPPALDTATSMPGDLWILGTHRLVCADAQQGSAYETLLKGENVDMLFTDPPFNVRIEGHVSGLGKHKHREFAFASGEMSSGEFTAFLAITLGSAAAWLRNGAIAYVFMDWRHMGELLQAGELVLGKLKQLCVWNKSNGSMGSFYRSKHELIFVFKKGTAPHVNNFGLGENGRYRTNVWDYPGISSATATRDADLAMHPTVKPVKLVQDAIEDCSHRGDIILDCFAGSGTTLIAAERSGRRARLIEYDPLYCDTIIRRFEQVTGLQATLGVDGPCFAAVSAQRVRVMKEA